MTLHEQLIVRKVRKLCIILFALDVFFFAIAYVSTYLALTKVPGVVEIGIAKDLMHVYGIELVTLASFCIHLALSAFSLAGAFSCVLSEKLHRQVIFYICFTELAGLTPSGFLQALNDVLVLVFRTNLLGTLNPAARSLALIIPSAANIIIFLLYIERIQKQPHRRTNAPG